MKKLFYLLITALGMSSVAMANPGDTTWVQASDVQFTHYGNFDTTIAFPSGSVSYRKILMIFTMGEYSCPAGSQYCHQWDYTVSNYIMTPAGDTLELSRFISPFATAGTPRFPSNWTQHYVFDVTDFYNQLKNSATFRINYSGYSWGFTGNVKFAFIEGTPERNVTGITKVYDGYYGYGNASDPINNHLPVTNITAPAGTQSADLRFTVSGHGSDANGCCEFMSHYYNLNVNGNSIAQKDIWRDDCGLNELYPQGGTWIFNRGNWCPGDIVIPIVHTLPSINAGTAYNVNIAFENYTVASPAGGYNTEAMVFHYGGLNKTTDASIEDIISPTDDENHFRENPLEGGPQIMVRNSGSTPITSIQFEYGIPGNWLPQYTWQGTLAPLQDTIITLPEIWDIYALSGMTGANTFKAHILQVNGHTDDDDVTNNVMTSSFTAAPIWPFQFVVHMVTNSTDVNGVDQTGNGGQSQTNWQILDKNGNVMASRTDALTRTTYNDTVSLGFGWYKLVVDDGGCDGLNWWLEVQDTQDFPNYHAGSFTVKKFNGSSIPVHGTTYGGTYGSDFGCGFNQYFTVGWALNVTNLEQQDITFKAYPNPAQNSVTVNFTGVSDVKGTIRVIDAVGRVVLETPCTSTEQTINTTNLVNGLYTVVYADEKADGHKLQARLLIAK
jgi:hypothetical protein